MPAMVVACAIGVNVHIMDWLVAHRAPHAAAPGTSHDGVYGVAPSLERHIRMTHIPSPMPVRNCDRNLAHAVARAGDRGADGPALRLAPAAAAAGAAGLAAARAAAAHAQRCRRGRAAAAPVPAARQPGAPPRVHAGADIPEKLQHQAALAAILSGVYQLCTTLLGASGTVLLVESTH